ncbi:MAG: preprotein translocase subunit YajC [Gammaproteobacteria bacterium]|nr:preprotein translocase subunit YajC [Gammaproteobacteria bacterium]
MSFFISEAMAEAPAAAAGAQQAGWEGLIFPIGLVVILYFFMIRPQVKRQKEHKALVESLKKGDEVQTSGGLMGKVTDVTDNFCKLEIAEGLEVKIRRSSVESVMPKGSLEEL